MQTYYRGKFEQRCLKSYLIFTQITTWIWKTIMLNTIRYSDQTLQPWPKYIMWYGGAEQQFLELSNLPIKCHALKTKLNQLWCCPNTSTPFSPHQGKKTKSFPPAWMLYHQQDWISWGGVYIHQLCLSQITALWGDLKQSNYFLNCNKTAFPKVPMLLKFAF